MAKEKQGKTEKFEIPTVDYVVPSIVPELETLQDGYRYGKNQEKLKASQVE